MRLRARCLIRHPLRLPVWSRGGRKRSWKSTWDALEGRVAADGPQGRYAPQRLRCALRPSRPPFLLRVRKGQVGTEGWSFQSNIGMEVKAAFTAFQEFIGPSISEFADLSPPNPRASFAAHILVFKTGQTIRPLCQCAEINVFMRTIDDERIPGSSNTSYSVFQVSTINTVLMLKHDPRLLHALEFPRRHD